MAFRAAEWRDKQQERSELVLAWYTAALSRAKRLPSLKSLLSPLTEHKAMTPEEIAEREAEFAELSARMGGNLGRRGNRTRKGSHSDSGDARQTG